MRTFATVVLTLLVSLQMMSGKVMEWRFSNELYKKAFKAGKAQLKIHVSDIPKELSSVLPNATARVRNEITRQEENSVVSIGEDSCYVLELNLPYPQFVYTQPFGSVYIAPGDTLEMFSTLESASEGSEPRLKTFRGNSESAMINTLLPEFMKKYGRKEYKYEEAQATIGKGKDATQAVLGRWANQVNEIIADEELRQALIHSPLSTFGKDLVMVSILTNKCMEIELLMSDYNSKANSYFQMEDGNWKVEPNPNFVQLDLEDVFIILLKIQAITGQMNRRHFGTGLYHPSRATRSSSTSRGWAAELAVLA